MTTWDGIKQKPMEIPQVTLRFLPDSSQVLSVPLPVLLSTPMPTPILEMKSCMNFAANAASILSRHLSIFSF